MAAFDPRDKKRVHLIFLCCGEKTPDDPMLEGECKDRRVIYFTSMQDVPEKKDALQRAVQWMD